MSKSPSDFDFFGLLLVQCGCLPESQLLEFVQCAEVWRLIAVSFMKMYGRMAREI